jgi:hypothetical protein
MGKGTSPPLPPDLTGVRLKLTRARAHIDAIRDKAAAFVGQTPRPFDVRVEEHDLADGSGGLEYRLFAVVRDQPPRDLAPMIGDAVHNIRSALDYLVYELAPPSVRESNKTQFPIYTDEDAYRKDGERLIKGIVGDERLLIERVQPWQANEPHGDPLEVLRRLSNRDKHRLLVPVIAAVNWREVSVGSDHADVQFTYVARDAVADGDLIVTFTARPTGAGAMTVQPRSGLHVALSAADTGIHWDRRVDELLEVLHHHVEQTVIDMWFKYGWLPGAPSA